MDFTIIVHFGQRVCILQICAPDSPFSSEQSWQNQTDPLSKPEAIAHSLIDLLAVAAFVRPPEPNRIMDWREMVSKLKIPLRTGPENNPTTRHQGFLAGCLVDVRERFPPAMTRLRTTRNSYY